MYINQCNLYGTQTRLTYLTIREMNHIKGKSDYIYKYPSF